MTEQIKEAFRQFCTDNGVNLELNEGPTESGYKISVTLRQVLQVDFKVPAAKFEVPLEWEGADKDEAWTKILKSSVYTAVQAAWFSNIQRVIHGN